MLLMLCPPLTKTLYNTEYIMTLDVFFNSRWRENKSKMYFKPFFQQAEKWEAIAGNISVKVH